MITFLQSARLAAWNLAACLSNMLICWSVRVISFLDTHLSVSSCTHDGVNDMHTFLLPSVFGFCKCYCPYPCLSAQLLG